MDVLKKNTVEPIIVSLRDRLEILEEAADLTNVRFDVLDSEDTVKISNGVPTLIAKNAICTIDTTTGGGWPTDEYRLYLKFQDGSTNPVLFVGKFRVEDD